jgi:2'-5' RNA ligase
MKGHYSIAICPPPETVVLIRGLKKELEAKIGKYPSRNSEAHITFNVFQAGEHELAEWEKYLAEFCSKAKPFTIRLNAIGSFEGNGAFFLAPDKPSADTLISLMQQFHQTALVEREDSLPEPHLSIARQLDKEQLKTAYALFEMRALDIEFLCDNLAIRQFNPKIGQYEVYKRFGFGMR